VGDVPGIALASFGGVATIGDLQDKVDQRAEWGNCYYRQR